MHTRFIAVWPGGGQGYGRRGYRPGAQGYGLGKEMAKCYNLHMVHSDQSTPILHADPEHGGLRLIVIIVLLLGLTLGFVIIQLLLSLLASGTLLIEFATALSCLGAIIFALGAAWISEVYLKRVWHSGISLSLGESKLSFQKRSVQEKEAGEKPEPIVIDWQKTVNVSRWYFQLSGYARAGRERRVSNQWFCLACMLQQDDDTIVVFAYFPPKEAAEWVENGQLSEPFHEISLAHLYSEAGKKKRDASTRPAIPSALLAGNDGRYWLAEKKRWQDGVELKQEDFTRYTEYIEEKLRAVDQT